MPITAGRRGAHGVQQFYQLYLIFIDPTRPSSGAVIKCRCMSINQCMRRCVR